MEGSGGGIKHQAASSVMVVDEMRGRCGEIDKFFIPLYSLSFTSFLINNWFTKKKLVYIVIYLVKTKKN